MSKEQRARDNAYFRDRTARLNALGLTARGTPIRLPRRTDLDLIGLHGYQRITVRKRLRLRELHALGLTSRYQPRKLGVLPPRELAWRQFRATLAIPFDSGL